MVNRMNKAWGTGASCNSQKGMQAGNNGSCMNTKLLYELQCVDFALADTVLYLDAYPCCAKALNYYKKLIDKRATLLSQLEAAGIVLTAMKVNGDSWTWGNGPWPWEYEANV